MKIKIFLFLMVCGVFLGVSVYSQKADAVAVTVKRVIFEGPKRAEVITVINNSNRQETYRMGWRHYKMTEDKSLVPVDESNLPPEVRPSNGMVRFSPRRFTLPARGSQQVRMMLRLPGGIEDGEYRSHLWIRPEAPVEDFKDRKDGVKSGKTGVSLEMLAGVSMPIIVRKGQLQATASIEELTFQSNGDGIAANFVIQRSGNRSVYGDLDFICNMGSGDEYLIKYLRGVSVYPETPRRNMDMNILYKKDKPACRGITLRYTETDGFKGDAVSILSEVTSPVQ